MEGILSRTAAFPAWPESWAPQIPAALLFQALSPLWWGKVRKAAISLLSLETSGPEFPTTTRIFCYFTLWKKDRSTSLSLCPLVLLFSVLIAWLITWIALKTTKASAPSPNSWTRIYGNGALVPTCFKRSSGCSNMQLESEPAGSLVYNAELIQYICKQG